MMISRTFTFNQREWGTKCCTSQRGQLELRLYTELTVPPHALRDKITYLRMLRCIQGFRKLPRNLGS
jgi:hypothetical protein